MSKRKTTEQFISDAIKVHGDKYDYSKVEYKGCDDNVLIICPIHGEFSQTPTHHLLGCGCKRCMADKMKSLCHGVGYNDYNGRTRVNGKDIPSYKHWYHMICRCYSPIFQRDNPTYKECSVCEEWLTFSNFKKWFDENYVEGYCLDKDILVQGNKIYSPDTCAFVPQHINHLLLSRKLKKTQHKRGIYWDKDVSKFRALLSIEGKSKKIGYFNTEQEAFEAYKQAKYEEITRIATNAYNNGEIDYRVHQALLNYKIEE